MESFGVYGDDFDLYFTRAKHAYATKCKRQSWIYEEPSYALSEIADLDGYHRLLFLGNTNGLIAVYQIRRGRLTYVPPVVSDYDRLISKYSGYISP